MRTEIVIVGHGSREAAANQEFEALVAGYARHAESFRVSHGHVELAEPPLIEALVRAGRRADRVIALPLFLFAAGHVKNDLPLALAEARRVLPGVSFSATRALGVHPTLVEIAFERAGSLGLPAGAAAARTALVVVGRGASDPDSNGDFCKVVRLLGEGRGFGWVHPTFIGITKPLVEDSLELLARARPERILVLPYFLFSGRLMDKLSGQVAAFQARFPWIRTQLAPHLGASARMFGLLDERVRGAIDGDQPLPCDTCVYRAPVAGIGAEVGGLRALLWSLRHSFTHTQAMPHVHAHRPLAKHVLVCCNADCADRGSVSLLGSLRRLGKEVGRERDIRITRTSCMGRCGEGPTVAVYPDGVWYRGVTPGDAGELVREHLLGDRLVSRLVDNIMQ
jgi:sirohydrochlorin ferrochelatase/(2Fe-2S) ferredoxin